MSDDLSWRTQNNKITLSVSGNTDSLQHDAPLVSICIPTYNRSRYLKQSIDRYIKQPEFLSGMAELVVSDNASTDDTEQMLREYTEHYQNILYFKNPENIRDRNFPLALSRGNGKLHFIHNDNLMVDKEHLKVLCHLAKKYQDAKPQIILRNEGKYLEEKICNGTDELIQEVSCYITWLGGFSLWHDECQGLEADIADCDLCLWQVRKACDRASKKTSIVIKRDFCYTPEMEKKDVSYGLFQVFHENLLSILRRYSAIQSMTVDRVERDLLLEFFSRYFMLADCNRDSNIQYNLTENLRDTVERCYSDKSYYDEYLDYYPKILKNERRKYIIKQLVGWDKNRDKFFFQWLKRCWKYING